MKNRNIFHLLAAFLIMFVLTTGSIQAVQAAEFDKDGQLSKEEVVNDDLFTGADIVVVDGEVNGNLLAAGNSITINGVVNGDALLMGRTIVISETAVINGNLIACSSTIEIAGQVTGSVFGGSAALILKETATVGSNVYYGGYSLETGQGSQIGIDLYAGVYQAMLKGIITRDTKLGAGAVELSGTIGRDAVIDLGADSSTDKTPPNFMKNMPFMQQPGIPPSIQPGLRVSEGTVIKGKLTYTSSQDMTSGIQAQPEGGVVYKTPVGNDKLEARQGLLFRFLTWLWDTLRKLITLLILGLLSVWLLPALLKPVVEQARSQTLSSAGYGALTVVLGYLAAIVAAGVILGIGLLISVLTLGGLSQTVFGLGFSGLALVFTVFTLLVSYGSKLVVAFMAGEWIMNKIAPEAKGKSYWAMVIGVVLYVILAAIPYIGWLVALIATIIGIGSMWLAYRSWRKSRKGLVEAAQA